MRMENKFLTISDVGKNGALRWIGGTLLILFCWFVLGGICATPFLIVAGIDPQFGLANGDPFWVYLGTNVTFLGIWLGLFVVMRWVHRRPFRTLVTPEPRVSWSRMATGWAVFFALIVIMQALEFIIYPDRLQWSFDLNRWLVFLPFILIFTPLQTTAEELLFRGYWLQGTGRLTKNILILCVVNGILFALPHMLNPEVLNNPNATAILFANYMIIGAAFALYTLRDQRLELAIGAHMANNLFAALVVTYADSALPTPAIIRNPVLDPYLGLVTTALACVAFYLIVFRWLGRRAAPLADPEVL